MTAAGSSDGRPAPGQPTSERVQGIFSRIAGRYDMLNILLSFGMDRLWRRRAVEMAALTTQAEALDLCAGTGDLTLALAMQGRPRSVTGTDFVPEMLEVAQHKLRDYHGETAVTFSIADAQALPFEDESFDVVTVGFGVRNLPDRAANFEEVHRVLRAGGRYVILEFSTPPNGLWRALYRFYNRTVVPLIGGLVSGDRASYQYLNDSILAFPDQERLAAELRAAGFSSVEWRNLSGGIVALHRAVK